MATVYEPFSPFERVIFEWKSAASAPAFALTRWHVDGFGTESDLRLVPGEELSARAPTLLVCAQLPAFDGDEPPPPSGPEGWALIEWHLPGGSGRVLLDEAGIAGPGRDCLAAIRDPVLAAVGWTPYAVPFWVEGEYGTLRTDASLVARVYVDDRPTGLTTPVRGLRLEPGRHRVRWVAVATGAVREVEVLIEAGVTTSLDIDL